jgi:NRPS condensation-like uncharacterized protein
MEIRWRNWPATSEQQVWLSTRWRPVRRIMRRDWHVTHGPRQLSGPERLRLMLPNANVVMAARIEGSLSAEELGAAVSKVRQRHPLLGARVQIDQHQTGWFTSQSVPAIPIRVVPRPAPDRWIEVAIEEHRQAFSYEIGPLIRIALLPSDGSSDMIVTAHHAICDGLSLAYLVRDILRHVAEPDRPVERLPVPPLINGSMMPVSVSGGLLSRLGIKIVNWAWERKDIAFDAADYRDLHRTFWQDHRGHMLAWALTEAQTAALVSRCRRERVTVNTALTTAFVAAQEQVEAGRDYLNKIVVSVDFRDRLTRRVDEAFAFYASAVRPELEYQPGIPFWDVARTFHTQIQQLLTDENIFESQQLSAFSPSLLDALAFVKYDRLEDKLAQRIVERMGIDRITASLVITNLGRLDIPVNYGSRHLAALYGPYVHSDTVEKYLGVATVGGRMRFTLCSGETLIDNETVEAVRDAAMDHLRRAAGW